MPDLKTIYNRGFSELRRLDYEIKHPYMGKKIHIDKEDIIFFTKHAEMTALLIKTVSEQGGQEKIKALMP